MRRGEDYPYFDAALEKAYQKEAEVVDRNACANSYLIEACINHEDAKLVVKSTAGGGMLAALVVKTLKDRFKVVQQSLKQAEITKFNTMVLKPGETCCRFVDKVKEQANKLANMGKKVSNTNLLTRLKEGSFASAS
jgi:hypothetical protein